MKVIFRDSCQGQEVGLCDSPGACWKLVSRHSRANPGVRRAEIFQEGTFLHLPVNFKKSWESNRAQLVSQAKHLGYVLSKPVYTNCRVRGSRPNDLDCLFSEILRGERTQPGSVRCRAG